jgi:hypothetical protein
VAWKFRLPNQISNPAGKGSELPKAYLWDVISMRIIIDTVGGELISARLPYLLRQLSVRKVVVTLTSRCAEIGLSMAGAKQQWDTRFIMVPTVSRTSSRGALVVLYCKAPWCS